MIIYQLLAKELLGKCYAEDCKKAEAYITYANARNYLGTRFHVPKHWQGKVVRDMVTYDFARFISKDILCIKTNKIL